MQTIICPNPDRPEGWVYVYDTEAWPGRVKIGMSGLPPPRKLWQMIMRAHGDALVSLRGKTIYHRLWVSPSDDRRRDERRVQQLLHSALVPGKQDFFTVSVDAAKRAVQEATGNSLQQVFEWERF